MRKATFVLLFLATVTVVLGTVERTETLRVSVASLHTDKLVNAHESVEDDGDIAKLRASMEDLGIDHTVLHGVPYDLLHYKGQDLISYDDLEQNHAFIQDISKADPEHFSFICAIDPADSNRLGKVEQCLEDGALGIKVYTGYSYAHEMALDDPRLLKVYDMIQENDALLFLPVKTATYQDELENVLTLYPEIDVVCPHYCLASKNLDRVRGLMDRYPNLHVDTSFGHVDFTISGMQEISENSSEFRAFFYDFQDRILFATDTVITGYEWKDRDWLNHLHYDYLSMMTQDDYVSRSVPTLELKGLNLPTVIQRKVLWKNWQALL